MLINQTIPNMMNGVSQQPITIRLPNQGEEQINASCRVANGLTKRLAVEVLRDNLGRPIAAERIDWGIFPLGWDQSQTASTIVRLPRNLTAPAKTVYEDVLIMVNTAWLMVVIKNLSTGETFEPTEQWVYLEGAKKEDIKFLSDGTNVYILNRQKVVELEPRPVDSLTNIEATNRQGSLAYVKEGIFSTTYRLSVKVINYETEELIIQYDDATYKTPSSVSATAETYDKITANYIMNNNTDGLAAKMASTITATPIHIEVTRKDNYVVFAPSDEQARLLKYKVIVNIYVDTSSTRAYAFNSVARDVTTLPATAPDGYTVQIDPDPVTADEGYWMKYSAVDNGWIETRQPGIHRKIKIATLPLKITDIIVDPAKGSDDPKLSFITIREREVGDEVTSPDPSFVGHRLNDMFIFNNRLGFLSKNNIVLSKIDDYETFYRTTTAQVLASDRVDITAAIPSTRYTELNYAVPFETNLMIFGDSAQYLLSTTTGFDLTKTALQTATEYETSRLCPPINMGSSIYYPITRSDYSGIYDLSRKDGIGLTAEEVTSHVSNYIKGAVTGMTYSSTEDVLFVRTDIDTKLIYVQNRFIRQTILEQNAWHKWELPYRLLSMQVVGSYLYLVMIGDDDRTLIYGKIDITIKRVKQGNSLEISFEPLIDNRLKLPQGSVLTVDDVTPNSYYIAPDRADDLIGVNINGGFVKGLDAINEALQEESLWVGLPYKMTYVFSQQVPAQYDETGKIVYQYAKLILRSMKLAYESTGKFNITVKPKGREEFVTEFTGTILGDEDSVLGRINLNTGVFKFPINCRSDQVTITISSDYPYPCTFNTCEWQGTLVNKSRRI